MPSSSDAATHGWSRRVFHYPPPTLMSRNFRLPCTIELQPLSLTPLKMRKVELDGQPGTVGGEVARGEVVEPYAVLEVADGVLDLGVAAMVGLQFQDVALSIGDEGVIAVGGEEGQLGAGYGLHPVDDKPDRRRVGRALEGRVVSLGHISGTLHTIEEGVQSASGMASMILRSRGCWRTVMEKRTRFSRQTATMMWVMTWV